MTVAIMSAMHEENASIVEAMNVEREQTIGSRTYYSGSLQGTPVVVVFSHWGKVAAAVTATVLINHFKVNEIIFTGVAGAVDSQLSIGDIVIATRLYQHDMDASPIIPRYEIPLLGRAEINPDALISDKLKAAAMAFAESDFPELIAADIKKDFSLDTPQILISAIASGDQFVSDPAITAEIRQQLPDVACVEMEGAAVAQVCESFSIPFGVVRTISDGANESSDIDFQAFISGVARVYSLGIVKRYLDVYVPERKNGLKNHDT